MSKNKRNQHLYKLCVLLRTLILVKIQEWRERKKDQSHDIIKCKKHFIKMLKDVGMVVPKIKETRL